MQVQFQHVQSVVQSVVQRCCCRTQTGIVNWTAIKRNITIIKTLNHTRIPWWFALVVCYSAKSAWFSSVVSFFTKTGINILFVSHKNKDFNLFCTTLMMGPLCPCVTQKHVNIKIYIYLDLQTPNIFWPFWLFTNYGWNRLVFWDRHQKLKRPKTMEIG